MTIRSLGLALALSCGVVTTVAAAEAPPAVSAPAPLPASRAPGFPEPRVRAWQLGLARPDRLQHAAFSYTAGLMVGLTSESPAAAAAGAFTLGVAKELWDLHRSGFDVMDLVADAVGAAGAAATTRRLTR